MKVQKVRVSPLNTLLLFGLSMMASITTVVLGPAFMAPLRSLAGTLPFVLLGSGISLIFWSTGQVVPSAVVLALTCLVGVFGELRDRGLNYIWAGAFALGLSWISVAIPFALWAKKNPAGWYPKLMEQFQVAVEGLGVLQSSGIKAEDFAMVMPSIVAVVLLFSLFFALLLEGRVAQWMFRVRLAKCEKLSDFRVPDFVVWLLILSLFGAFYKAEIGIWRMVALNVLNFTATLYFFQGLAVAVRILDSIRVGRFWRTLGLSFFALNMFWLFSVVGLVDYWADFRGRLERKATSMNKSF